MSELDAIVIFFFGILLGFYVGRKVAHTHFRNLLEKALDDIEMQEALEQEANLPVNIYIELKDGMMFAYKAETHEYLAHAADGNALVDKLKIRFPNQKYMTSEEDLDKILKNTPL